MIASQISEMQETLCDLQREVGELRQEMKNNFKDNNNQLISVIRQVVVNELRKLTGGGSSLGQQEGAAENISHTQNSNNTSMNTGITSAGSSSTLKTKKRKLASQQVDKAQKIVLQNLDEISPEELWRMWNKKEEGGDGFHSKKKQDFKSVHHYDQYRVVAQLIAAVRFNTMQENKTEAQGLSVGLQVARELMPNNTPNCTLGIEDSVKLIRERLVIEECLVGKNMGVNERRSALPFTRKPRVDRQETRDKRRKTKT